MRESEPIATDNTLSWTNGRGIEQRRDIKFTLDVRDYRDSPSFALLLLAANRHLSIADLDRLLYSQERYPSRSWIDRRRWFFRNPKEDYPKGPKPNPDGKDAQAFAIMRDNTDMSPKRLRWLLIHNGIKRPLQWVRMWRHNIPDIEANQESTT